MCRQLKNASLEAAREVCSTVGIGCGKKDTTCLRRQCKFGKQSKISQKMVMSGGQRSLNIKS